jgi:hypothetical protein
MLHDLLAFYLVASDCQHRLAENGNRHAPRRGIVMDSCFIELRPVEWIQTISTRTSIYVEGRSLIVNCKLERDHEFVLSNKRNLHDLSVNLSILDGPPTRGNGEPLERGIGLLSFFDRREQRDDIDGNDAFVGGWFCLKPDLYADLWEQVREGGYSDCLIDLDVAPVAGKGFGWVWDVEAYRSLFILSASVKFTRKAFEEKAVEEAAPRWSLFARR